MKLTFIQLPAFDADWRHLKLSDDDARALELELMRRPDAGPAIQGACGVRKLRFAPQSWASGKSGAVRVIYAHFPKQATIYLFLAYGKNEQGNLTPDEKKACCKLMREIKALLDG